MTAYDWQVYKHNGTSWVELTNVQGLAFSYGQRQLTDTWSPPVWTLTGRLPDDLGTVNIGDWVAVIESGSPEFIYQVTNYEVFYGIEPSMDVWSMQIETAFSALGRSLSTCSWTGDVAAASSAILTSVGLGFTGTPQGTPSSQSITNENGLDVFTRLLRTLMEYTSGGETVTVPYYTGTPWSAASSTASQNIRVDMGSPALNYSFYFTDETPVSAEAVYDGLNFGSLNLNYANKVVVTPVGGSAQTVGTGNNAFETTTYSATNDLALGVAYRYAGLLGASASVPLSISYTKEQQPSGASLPGQLGVLNSTQFTRVRFRGEDFYATIIGQDLTATPGSTRVTLHLCASENSNFFTLDSASLGVLDQNRLGF